MIEQAKQVAQRLRNNLWGANPNEAADTIDALIDAREQLIKYGAEMFASREEVLAENKKLYEENFALAAGHCIHDDGLTADEGGTPYCAIKKKLDQMTKLYEKAYDEREDAYSERDQLRAQVEQLTVQLAGCGVAALGNTESSKAHRAKQGDYGYSESYADVCRAVDREIELRAELEAIKSAEPVAWGYMTRSGLFDVITPEEHAREPGDYTIPLYTHSAPEAIQPVNQILLEALKEAADCIRGDWGNTLEVIDAAIAAAEQAPQPAELTDGEVEAFVDVAYKHWQDKTTFDLATVRADFRAVLTAQGARNAPPMPQPKEQRHDHQRSQRSSQATAREQVADQHQRSIEGD